MFMLIKSAKLTLSVNSYTKFDNFSILRTMSEAVNGIRKPRYDGRTKKRQWEERRTDSGDGLNVKREKSDTFERVKRRKFVLLLGYSGVNYYGMQRNPNMPTIEEDLFKALLAAELISDEAYKQVQTIQFQRAARTDKGVSAARQVCSIKLPEATDIVKVNALLPETIRIFGIRRVTKGFNSKSQCDGRTYFYMLPTVSFADFNDETTQETFRLSDAKFDRVNEILKHYIGTKNFHNYTSKKRNNDPSANRYIMSFLCEKPFVSNGIEFAVLKVKGQSFMMHQIRKMVGLMLAAVRGHTNEDIFPKSFTKERVNVPKAPGLGLVLEFPHYDRYNNRYGADHDKLEWKEEEDVVNAFKEKYIYPTIVETEVKEKPMLEWLTECLLKHHYDITEDDANDEDDAQESGDDDDKKSDENSDLITDKNNEDLKIENKVIDDTIIVNEKELSN